MKKSYRVHDLDEKDKTKEIPHRKDPIKKDPFKDPNYEDENEKPDVKEPIDPDEMHKKIMN